MATASTEPAGRGSPRRIALSPTAAILLAISFGLCAGYLDLAIIARQEVLLESGGILSNGAGFPLDASRWATRPCWSIPGLVVAAVSRLRPGLVSLRAGSWLFATLAIWAALLRMPLYGACSLLLAVGLGRLIGDAVAARGLDSRRMRYALAALLGRAGRPGGRLVGPAGGPRIPRGGRLPPPPPRRPQRRA